MGDLSRPGRRRRLDLVLQEKKPELSRSRIRAEIMTGNVLVDGKVCDKPGTPVDHDARIILQCSGNPYVSRGGLKMEGVLKDFSLDVTDLTVLDVGASTGGFTDCLLQKGAKMIYALDVGYGQLDLKLRNDPRVVVMERRNVRELHPYELPTIPDLAVVDVSFISLRRIFPVLGGIPVSRILALVKPQFEVGKVEANRGKGVIRSPEAHQRVLKEIIGSAEKTGYCCQKVTYSHVPGPKGNIEYFILLTGKNETADTGVIKCDDAVPKAVDEAFRVFKRTK
ncbi:MAG TPA: TlyA family RNA methyltransferase [Firmicutes bacterium]|nr:TlyA family RNA methyltransferase [Bacillota bacterium]